MRHLHHQLELATRVVLRHRLAAAAAAREAALRADAELLERNVLGSLVDLALQLVFGFQVWRLGTHQAKDHPLALRYETQGREVAGALGVVFEAVDADVELVEQRLGDRLVAALGHPGAFQVAAAQMNRHRHALGPRGDAFIEEMRIARGQLVGVLAARFHVLAGVHVAVARQRGIVELQVSAAFLRQLVDLVAVDPRQGTEVALAVTIDGGIERLRPEEVVHDVGRGHGHLGHAFPDHGLEEAVVVGDDALAPLERRFGVGRRRDPDHRAFVPEAQGAIAQAESLHGVDEPRRPAPAAELPVGDRRQGDRVLESHGLAHAFVVQALHLVIADLSSLAVARGLDRALRPEEAADVLDAKRRPHWNSLRSSRAPSTIAFSLPNATSLGRYFMPQSGATITFSGFTCLSAFFSRSTTFCGVSIVMSERSMQPTMIFLSGSLASTAVSRFDCAVSIETCLHEQAANSGRKE